MSTIRDDVLNKASFEMQSQFNQTIEVTLQINGNNSIFVDVRDGKCSINLGNTQTKSLDLFDNSKLSFDFFFMIEEGEHEIEIVATNGEDSVKVSIAVKTYEETPTAEKIIGEKNARFGSYYWTPIKNIEAYKTIIRVVGNVFVILKNVDKLM